MYYKVHSSQTNMRVHVQVVCLLACTDYTTSAVWCVDDAVIQYVVERLCDSRVFLAKVMSLLCIMCTNYSTSAVWCVDNRLGGGIFCLTVGYC